MHATEEDLKAVMRRVPAAVTVVTAGSGDEARGMTVGSFTSVSLEPLLVSFNVGKVAAMKTVLIGTDHFYVHLLEEHQEEISNTFARPDLHGSEQFADVMHRFDAHGTPILVETLAYIRCEKIAVYDAGDHCLIIGKVEEVQHLREGRPLIYYERGYRSVSRATSPEFSDRVD